MALFFKKKYPAFWQDYESRFSDKMPSDSETLRFVIFDTETTGLDASKNKLLSIGAVNAVGNTISVNDSFEVFIQQEQFNRETVPIHGIRKHGSNQKITEEEAIAQFLGFIQNSVLVAHHVAFDVAMINHALKKMGLPKLKNKLIDTSDMYRLQLGAAQKAISLDTLCKELKVPMHDRHTALGDAFITAQVFLKLLSHLKQQQHLKLVDLYVKRQQHWV